MFLYLVGIVPCIWILELELQAERQNAVESSMSRNVTCGFKMNNMTETLFGFGTAVS